MAIIPNAVKTKGAGVFVAAGGRGRGFRVEPAGVYPVPTFPVLVRMHVDANGTKRDLLTSTAGTRWPDHGFVKLELEAGDAMEWTVTVYETNSDWDENPPTQLATVRNLSPGSVPTGPVALSVVAMRPTFLPAGVMTGGVTELRSTTMAVPCLVEGPTGAAWPLKAASDGRLLVSTVPTPSVVALGSGIVTRNPGAGLAEEVLGAPIDTSAYRGGVVLRIGRVAMNGGTTPTVRCSIRSLKQSMFSGVLTDFVAATYPGAEVSTGGAGELTVGLQMHSTTTDGARTISGYVMRAQPVLTFTGGPIGYEVPWELWGLP
uniref:Uncharacterized protein n=1 Tax=Myxococcus fulvus TaxID=33 RepID=B0YR19_MYXFU|nr:hypothetical protein pMF1.10 [Myxococcus fulvus]